MRPELSLNTFVAALRLEGCGPESLAFLLAEAAVDALTSVGLREGAFEAGVEHLAEAMRDRAAQLRAAHSTPVPRSAPLVLIARTER